MRQGDIYLGHRREPRPVASGTWGLLPPSPQRWNARCQANVDLYVYTVVDVTCLEYAVLRAHRFAFVTPGAPRTHAVQCAGVVGVVAGGRMALRLTAD